MAAAGLAAQISALDAERRAVAKEAKRARRAEQAAAKAVARQWVLPEQAEHTLLIIFAMTDGAVEPAAKFLGGVAQKRRWPAKSPDELEHIVNDTFLAAVDADMAKLVGLTDESAPTDERSMRVALWYVLEWRLVVWASGLNARRGVAPTTDMVLMRWEIERLTLPEALRPPPRGGVDCATSREWARRWRERWGATFSRVRVSDEPPVADAREKVTVFHLSQASPAC